MLHPPAGQIGNQHRHTAAGWCPSRCPWAAAGHSRASKQRRSPPAHQAPPVRRATRELRDKRGLTVGLGGGARGRRGLDGMCTAMKSPTGVEGAGGSGGLGQASRSTTPSRRFTHGGNREARVARGAGPRCRRVRRAWPGFEIDDSEPQVHAWREPRGPRGPRSRAEVPEGPEGLARLRDRRLRAAGSRMEGTAWPAEPGRGAGGRRQSLARLRDRPLRAAGSRVAISRAAGPDGTRNTRGATSNKQHRKPGGPPPTGTHSPTTTSTHNETRPRPVSRPRPRHSLSATHRSSGTASDQAVMSTWSSTAARPASRRATGTRNGEQDT